MAERETADVIEAEAARWIWRLDRAAGDPARRTLEAELETWLSGDERRRGAWLKAEAAWLMLDRGSQLQGAPAARSYAALDRRSLLWGAGLAAAASASGLGVWLWRAAGDRYGARLGEIRHVPLKDGSTAVINTDSRIQVALSEHRRVVKLDHGEVWFQVAKNPKRPFVVEAGAVRVQAVGTAFSVRRRDGGADVLVTEGVVEAWSDGAEGHKARIAAGEKAFVSDHSAIAASVAAPSEVERKLAWRDGKIDLAGETLAEAAADFNRYNGRKLVIGDAALAGQRVYGVFRTDDPEGFAEAVHASLGARVATGPDQIRVD